MPFHSLSEGLGYFNRDFRSDLPKPLTVGMGRKMFNFRLVCLSLSLVSQLVLGVDLLLAAEKAKAKIVVSDVLTTPGKPVKLQAHVFEEGLLGRQIDLGGETLEFLVQGKVVGMTMTGGDGRAFWEFAPRMRGNLEISVRLPESPRVLAAEATGLLASWERRRPILFIDVAAIVQQQDTPTMPSLPINLSPTLVGEADVDAPGELEKLGKFYYNLVYVYRTGGSEEEEAVQEWIQSHDFPVGFLRIIPHGSQPLIDLIAQFREGGWENLTGGIGRTIEFAEVLVENRLKAVIVHDPEDNEGFPRRAVLVKSWKRVRKHL